MSARYFYVWIAAAYAIVVFGAFTRTYWAPIGTGTVDLHPAIHLHAVLFFGWTVFFLVQTTLVARGRSGTHRQLGLLGIALAAMMVFAGITAAIVSLKSGIDGPRPQIARTAAALSFSGMTLFSTFMILGIANVLKPERHRRFMVLATFSILQAAIARWIMLIPAIQQPLRILIGAIIVDIMLIAILLADARIHRRISPVYAGGLAFVIFVQWARTAILPTQAWMDFTRWLASL